MTAVWDLIKVVIGAALGYWLSQRGSDRQFRRQQARQRVDEARKIYVEARTQAVRLTGAMHRGAPGDGLSDADRVKVDEMQRKLSEVRIALDVHGAAPVATALERVAMDGWDLLTGRDVAMTDSGVSVIVERDFEAYYEVWERMREHLEGSQAAWQQWQADQEAGAGRWAWVGRWRAWSWALLRKLRRRPAVEQPPPPDTNGSSR
jgi:hypothetical protein